MLPRCDELALASQEAQEEATKQRQEARAQAFVPPEEPVAKRAAAPASSEPSLAELTAKFKKQGEERKKRAAAEATGTATDEYLEEAVATRKRRKNAT